MPGLLGAGALACAVCFAGFLFYWSTDSFQALRFDSLEFAPLDGPTVLALLCTWGSLLCAVVFTLVARRLWPQDTQNEKPRSSTDLMSRVRRAFGGFKAGGGTGGTAWAGPRGGGFLMPQHCHLTQTHVPALSPAGAAPAGLAASPPRPAGQLVWGAQLGRGCRSAGLAGAECLLAVHWPAQPPI